MSGFWDALEGGVVGIAVGQAASAVADPAFEPAKQSAWQKAPHRIHDLEQLATLVAQALLRLEDITDSAERNGYGADETLAAVQLQLKAPGIPEVLNLYRKNAIRPVPQQIDREQLLHAFAKAQIEYQYWPALEALVDNPLSPADVALGIVRNTIKDPGIQAGANDTTGANVQAPPIWDTNAYQEAAGSGIDDKRLAVLVGNVGLPMPPVRAASAYFRGLINLPAYYLAVAQSDTRPAWANQILDEARQILTAREWSEAELRGFKSADERRAGAALHGMSEANSDLLTDTIGRGLSVKQVTTGKALGGVFPGSYDQVPDPWKSALQRSDIRPEYASLAYANRFSQPQAFVIRALLKDSVIDGPTGETWLIEAGWPPAKAKIVAAHYSATATARRDPHLTSATTAAYTALRKGFVGGAISAPALATYQTELDAAQTAANPLLAVLTILKQIEATPAPAPAAPPGP